MAEKHVRHTCHVGWVMPVSGQSCDFVTHHKAAVESLTALFELFDRVEKEARTRRVITSVCLDNPSGECLYVGLAGNRWTFFYLRMPDVGDGELFKRSVGDPSANGSTPVIFEFDEDTPNTDFVSRELGMQIVQEWWEHKTLSKLIEWRQEQ